MNIINYFFISFFSFVLMSIALISYYIIVSYKIYNVFNLFFKEVTIDLVKGFILLVANSLLFSCMVVLSYNELILGNLKNAYAVFCFGLAGSMWFLLINLVVLKSAFYSRFEGKYKSILSKPMKITVK